MENFLLKDKRRTERLIPTTSIRDWLNDLSNGRGLSPTIQKYEKLPLIMDY
jgi:hypothetical protein